MLWGALAQRVGTAQESESRAHDTSKLAMTSSSGLCCLPLESLSLIASQLQGTDRRALAACCSQLAGCAQLVTQTLVLPGSQLLALGRDQGREHTHSGADSWGCACSTACTLDDGLAGVDDDEACTETHQGQEAPACSWSERYSGVRHLTVTCCDGCRDVAAAAAALDAGLLTPTPGSPHTPTQGGVTVCSSWVAASCCSPSMPSSSTSDRLRQVPRISLGSFLAAAGHNMPYLQELHLAAVCPCLRGSSPAGHQGVLSAIAASCPCLDTLTVPTWLLQPSQPQQQQQQPCSSLWSPSPRSCSLSMPLLRLPAAAAASASWGAALPAAVAPPAFQAPSSVPLEPFGLERLVLHSQQPLVAAVSAGREPGSPSVQLQQQLPNAEQLSVLTGLQHLTSLKLSGAAPPAAAVRQLAELTRLQRVCFEVTCTHLGAPTASPSGLPGWQQAGAVVADEHADSSNSSDDDGEDSGSSTNSGAVLGASLAGLADLRTVCLTGVMHATDTLKALSVLPRLARVELDGLPDFAVASLATLSGLAHLTALRLRGCKALQATARSALPLQLHSLQCLAVLDLDFDLHLRDMQVLCLLKGLSHLTARSFHHCIHLMTGLTLPGLRFLSVTRVSRFALQQQDHQQQLQQQGLPAGYQLVQGPAGPQLAAAAAWAEPAPEVAAGAAMPGIAAAAAAAGDAAGFAQPAAAAGVPVMPLSALPVLLNLQQQHHQQQQGEQPPLMLLTVPGGQALLVQHPPQHGSAPVPLQLPSAGPHAHAQQQQAGVANGFNLQLLQLRQQQLHLQQQQLRLQQQQVRLQLQQMQAQAQAQLYHQAQPQLQGGVGMQAEAAAAQAAAVVPQQQGQHPQQQQNGAAAAAGGACVQPKGWLAVLFPGLEELHLTSAKDCAPAVPALQGHQTLQRLVIGSRQPGPPPAQQQQLGAMLAEAQSTCSSGHAGGGGSAEAAALYDAAGYGVASRYRGVGAPWGVLKSLASLEELEIHDTAVVLGTMPWSLGVAVSGQLCRLVLRNAGCLMDLSAATLLGPYTWSKLTHLEVHGAEALTNHGLNCFSSLPCLDTFKLSYCPAITARGLASFLLNCSSSTGRVELLCCAGVRPAEAAAVQDAVWGITNRRVEVAWSRHDPFDGPW